MISIQILLAVCLIFGGFYFFIDTLERSSSFTPDEGGPRAALSCFIMACGGLVTAFILA